MLNSNATGGTVASVTATAAGVGHSLFLKNDGTVWATGNNGNGQFGDGSTTNRTTPVQVSNLSSITAIAAGQYHSLFLKNDGIVWATGKNNNGQLGNGSTTQTTIPVKVSGLSGIIAIAAGNSHSLFLKNDGTVWATGLGGSGQLGDGNATNSSTPVQVSGVSGIAAIIGGGFHSLFLKNNGTVWATGYNGSGQLGNATYTASITPVQVSSLSGINAIAGGESHSLFLKNDGTVWATGYNLFGQLGDGSTTDKTTPVKVSSLSGITAIAGGSYHSLFLKNDGIVLAAGFNAFGQLGDASISQRTTPVQVSGLSGIIAIAGGQYHSLFLKNDGNSWAVGINQNGQLGDASTTDRTTPVQVIPVSATVTAYQWLLGGSNITGATASTYTATTAGSYTVRVTNSSGCSITSAAASVTASGNNTTSAASTTPTICINTALTNITHTTTGATGIGTSTGLPAGITAAWSSNTITISGTPTASGTFNYSIPLSGGCGSVNATGTIIVNNGIYSASLSSSTSTICAGTSVNLNVAISGGTSPYSVIYSGGTVNNYTNGSNISVSPASTTTYSLTSVTDASGCKASLGWKTIKAGPSHMVGIKADGSLWAWGNNYSNQLGDGSDVDRSSPVQIGNSTNWASVAPGFNHTVATKTDGTLWAWGYNNVGELGDGTTTNRSSPVQIGNSTWGSVAAGGNYTIATKTDGSLWAWGDNTYGQLGDGSTMYRTSPVLIGSATNWATIATGQYHTIATKTDGTLWAWGRNDYGQLGDGSNTTKTSPMQIGSSMNWASVAAGFNHTISTKTDGSLWAWGNNGNGQLGDGFTTFRASPVQIGSAITWASIAAGEFHTIAIQTDGSLWTWGKNGNGQLGDGSTTQNITPVKIGSPMNWSSITAGSSNTIAKKADGSLWAWGYNTSGQLGNGTQTQSLVPVQIVATGSSIVTVTAANTAGAASATPTLCMNSALTNITHSTTGATGIGTATGLPTGVTTAWASNTITVSGTPTSAGTFNYSIPLTGGCGSESATGTITVTAANTISLSSSVNSDAQTVNANNAITTITYSTTGATGATVNGLPTGVVGNWLSNVFTISGTPSVSGTFNYTITLLGGGCGTVTKTGSIVVINQATLGNYSTTSVISGQNTSITPSAAPTNAASIVAYTNTNFSGVLTVNTTTGVVTVTNAKQAGSYTLTLKATSSTGLSATTTFTLTVTKPACSQGLFSGSTSVTVGASPYSVAVGDFNGDGKQDIATANYGSNSVSIRLGDGIGGFSGSTSVTLGASPYSVAVGDFNGDGKQDIATANYGSNSVSIRLGDGTGGFSGSTNVSVGTDPTSVAVGDFNGDGKQDIASAIYTSNSVSIRLGDGTGGFSGSTNVSVGSYPISVAVGDFNGDGKQDIATANYGSNSVSIRLGDGTGGFSGSTEVTVGSGSRNIAVGDFNGDGKQDIATAIWVNNTVSIRLGDGTGGFSGSTNVSVGNLPWNVAVGDFNGDGKQDIATANYSSNTVSISLGNGSGGFSVSTNVFVGSGPASVAVGDFNGDGKQDIAIANNIDGTVSIRLGGVAIMNVLGNTNTVANGTTTTTQTNATNFGSTCIGSSTTSTYTIQNTGITALTISTGGITLSGTDASLFTVGGIMLPATIAANSTATFTVSFSPTTSGAKTAQINIANNTCDIPTYTYAIGATVTANNSAGTASSTPTVCINTAITNITHTTTGATGIGTATGLPSGVTAAWASNTITISGSPTAVGVFNYSIPLTGGCGAVNAIGTITVTANNTASAASTNPTVCINTALTNIIHTTTGATGIGTTTGLPSGVTAAWASNTITISGTPTAVGVFNYSIPLTGGCGTVNATGTITVTANKTVSAASSTPTVCINTALTNITHTTTGATGIGTTTGLPSGVTAAWASNTITISGTPTTAGTFNYSIPLTGGCGTVSATGTITVTANKTVSAASSTPTVCTNTALTNITHTTASATGIGTATGLPAGVTAAWASNTITISGTPTAAGTFSYTIPLTGGCGTVSATGTITVSASPVISSIGNALNFNGTNNYVDAGALISSVSDFTWEAWIKTSANGTIISKSPLTGIWAQGGKSLFVRNGKIGFDIGWVAAVETPNTYNDGSWHHVALTAQKNTSGSNDLVKIYVDGVLAATKSDWDIDTYSEAGLYTKIGYTNVDFPSPSYFSGTIDEVRVWNTVKTQAGLLASMNKELVGNESGLVEYYNFNQGIAGGNNIGITTLLKNTTSGHNGTLNNFNLFGSTSNWVSNTNLVTAFVPSTQTVCIGTAVTNTTIFTTVATGIGTATGLPPGVTAAWASNIITISGTPTASGIFNYSIPLVGGCGTVSATGTITVTANNTVGNASVSPTGCINTVLTSISHGTTGATGIGTATGLPTGVTAFWGSDKLVISGTPTVAGTFNYSIPLTGGCGSVSATGTITVTAANTITLSSAVSTDAQTVNQNNAITSITYSTTGATGASITGFPTGVSGNWASNVYTISGTPSVSGTFNYTITLTGGCGTVTKTGSITIIATPVITWTGTTSTDWNTANNWSTLSVPASGDKIAIPSAPTNQPTLAANTTVKEVLLNGKINLNGKTLTLTGAVTGSGVLKSTGLSSVEIKGNVGTLYFDAVNNSVTNLTITTGSVTLGNALNVTGVLTPTSGTLNTGDFLTLKSTSITTSAVLGIVGGTVNGKVTVERFIPKGYKAFRQLCTGGVYNAGSIFSNWQENGASPAGYGMYIFGKKGTSAGVDATTGLDLTDSGRASMYTYTNYLTYTPITNTKTTQLNPYLGYYGVVYGDRTKSTHPATAFDASRMMHSATTIRSTGQLITGTVTYSTTGVTGNYSSSDVKIFPLQDTGVLIANPYAAPIDWHTITKTNMSNSYWYVDPTFLTSAGYQVPVAYNAIAGTNSNVLSKIGRYIQAGQAFWVFTDATTNSNRQIVITENNKAIASTRLSVFGASTINRIAIGLWNAAGNLDGAVAVFDNSFSKGYGPEDSKKLFGTAEALVIEEAGKALCISGLPNPINGDNITFGFAKLKKDSTYQLSIDVAEFQGLGMQAYLKDAYLGTQTLITSQSMVSFTITSNTASYAGRFSIVFKPAVTLPLHFVSVAAQKKTNGAATIQWHTTNERGIATYTVERSNNGSNFEPIGNQQALNQSIATYQFNDEKAITSTVYYRIKAVQTDRTVLYSKVIAVSANTEKEGITVYPNPAKASGFNLLLNNAVTGEYSLVLHNSKGRKVYTQALNVATGTSTIAVQPTVPLSSGVYLLSVESKSHIYQTQIIIN